MRARSGWADEAGGRALTRQSGGRADERTGGQGGKGANSRADGRTRPTRRRHADGQKRHGRGPGGADGRTGPSKVADERVGLGLKGHIPQGPLHSWAPSPLASSERERAGCVGVQWGLARLHVKHPYLAPGLTCLV